MDLYKEGCLVLEAKQGSEAGSTKVGTARRGTDLWSVAMQEAYGQALKYARTLASPPPFLIACDLGHCFDLFACFDGSRQWRPFPDPAHNRLFLRDLEAQLPMLRAIFIDPLSLDPARRSAAVTREVAGRLATLARELHAAKHDPEQVARFLMRCLFTMFAEDAGLLPDRVFTKALETEWIPRPEKFPADIEALWQAMNHGQHFGFVGKLLRFNGGLFVAPSGLPLKRAHLTLLLEAAKCNWSDVEPAIFGTLLERALDPVERHQLGAHFTPRAYVERLVRPTIEEPMREDWDVVRTEAHRLVKDGKTPEAIRVVRDFHHRLCHTRVLDPACGSGNFLYVTLDLFKRLEAEVLALLTELGDKEAFIHMEGVSVTPQQFLGIEVKRWAKEIAELVLWIGYLQWHHRTHGTTPPREPILHDYRNIACRDAVLAYDREELVCDPKTAKPITRWDGRTYKKSPVTGEEVPDESARVPLYRYVNPRKAEWPDTEFVVGNPPFIGNKRMRLALGDGYVEALREVHSDVPESADYVMYWWNHAANQLHAGNLRRFGLISTNSIVQGFNRSTVQSALDSGASIVWAIPDHPWVDTSDGAAVRVAMTVVAQGPRAATLSTVIEEADGPEDDRAVVFRTRHGQVFADLTIGTDVTGLSVLRANKGLAFTGMYPLGQGFVLEPDQVVEATGGVPRESEILRPFFIARDLTQVSRQALVIDFFPRSQAEARAEAPHLFQWVYTHVKPQRDLDRVAERRRNWWLFTRPVPPLRAAVSNLARQILVPRTSKFFSFQFQRADAIPDTSVVAIASADAFLLGVLSSRVHLVFALRAAGRLGVGNDPRYQHSSTFLPFPFPAVSEASTPRIRALGESLDAHRKQRQAMHPSLSITGMYNVLTKLRSGESLTAREKVIHEQGLVSVLRQIHDDLDAAVFDAYGWPHDLADEEILERLVALNRERAEEEKNGLVRWLRPEFQAPKGAVAATQAVLAGTEEVEATEKSTVGEVVWPKKLPGQIAAVRELFRGTGRALRLDEVVRAFKGAKKKDAETVLESLTALGLLTAFEAGGERRWRAEGRAAA